jgi:hypothetical protein
MLLAMLSVAPGCSLVPLTENLIDGRDDLSMTFRYLAAALSILAAGIVYVVLFRIFRRIAIVLGLISRSDAAHLAPVLSSWPDAWYNKPDTTCVRRNGG